MSITAWVATIFKYNPIHQNSHPEHRYKSSYSRLHVSALTTSHHQALNIKTVTKKNDTLLEAMDSFIYISTQIKVISVRSVLRVTVLIHTVMI
jgi:hypothetical protein